MADFKELIDHALARVPDAARISIALDGQGKITIERFPHFSNVSAGTADGPAAVYPSQPHGTQPPQPKPVSGGEQVKAPLVGVFYTAPAPDTAPFAAVGQKVKKGDTLCIIEAMKLMNEIESTHDGIISAILAENGAMVEFGQALFEIKVE